MVRLLHLILLCLLGALPVRAEPIYVLSVQGAIGPAGADYVTRALERAAEANAQLVVLKMDTPGGLDTSMRAIIKAILASPVPVAGFVAPGGARAASAGTYILYACHIAAMAPGTNLGAATPVAIGIGGAPGEEKPVEKPDKDKQAAKPADDKDKVLPAGNAMTRKQVHDAAAYIRSLAELRGRNVEWAERAVREAVSLSAPEALEKNVIDLVAEDVPDLLAKIEGRKVKVAGGAEKTLATQDAVATPMEPDWRSRLLAVVGDPSIAYILMLLGIYGLFFEFSNPGFGIPGVIGAICLLLALFAFQLLPISYAGLALILLGMAFMVAEAFVPSFGVLGLGGIVAFIAGSVMLLDTDLPGYGIPWGVVLPAAAVSAGFLILVVGMFLRSRRRPVTTGPEELIGALGRVEVDFSGEGWVHLHGETWRAVCPTPLAKGARVRVTGLDGLVLRVEPVAENT
ncbi:MAG TPA: nodulation protein NfeD [Thiobacillaceae bacterium]|nr:nodulation protein NfeD [Thiobacillaceae bacterium]